MVIIAFSMTAILAMAAIGNDVGLIVTARNQLQSAVDASALAATSGLTVSQSEAMSRGIRISANNTIIQQPLNLQGGEITFLDSRTVRVTVTRTVNLFFSRFFGLNTTQIQMTATATIGNRDVMLLFDRSGSMDDDTVDPNVPQPITDTQNAAIYFVNKIQGNSSALDRVGLVSYSTNATLDRGLTSNFGAIINTIQSYEADGFTNIGGAIRSARRHQVSRQRSRTYKVQILLSDGMANRPGSGMPTNPTARRYALKQARRAADKGVKIFTISLGNQTDQALMNQIANITGGRHFYAPTTADLDAIFDKIAEWIPVVLIS